MFLIIAPMNSCIVALITTSVDISMLVLTGLTLLATTQSFQCTDEASGLSTECRLCGEINPLTKDTYQCDPASDSFKQSLEGFSSTVVWLIFAAFHLGKAVQVTRLGRRLSLWMISLFGSHILGLAYAIVLSGKLSSPLPPIYPLLKKDSMMIMFSNTHFNSFSTPFLPSF
jgi:DASS family divalent anion:Na+ symporter